jgi:hypothetical protein
MSPRAGWLAGWPAGLAAAARVADRSILDGHAPDYEIE